MTYSRGILDADRQRRLQQEVPGWTWDPFADQWEEGFSQLQHYVESNGDARVSRKYSIDGTSWVTGSPRNAKNTPKAPSTPTANNDSKTCPAGHGRHRRRPRPAGWPVAAAQHDPPPETSHPVSDWLGCGASMCGTTSPAVPSSKLCADLHRRVRLSGDQDDEALPRRTCRRSSTTPTCGELLAEFMPIIWWKATAW